MKKKGFTLIELIAVLVIMAILALIVTPLVISIIRKARVSADKRSIDAYGRSIELAVASYLLDTGRFPTDISQLTIEYSGREVVCETTQLNPDSSVYLTGCLVGGRSVDYVYGQDKQHKIYSVGDEVTYNGVDYYVIKDSDASEEVITLLKKEPLTVAEVNTYGEVGTSSNHVNMYLTNDTNAEFYQTANDINGYGGMAYYSSATCGYSSTSGCTISYVSSDVKYVVDAWKNAQAPLATEARLITYDEINDIVEFEEHKPCGDGCGVIINVISSKTLWMYDSYYAYWVIDDLEIYRVDSGGTVGVYSLVDDYHTTTSGKNYVVRPVIVLPKSALE